MFLFFNIFYELVWKLLGVTWDIHSRYQGGFFRVQPILLVENNNGRVDNNNQVLQNEVVGPQAVPQQQNAQVPTVQPEARTNANEENEEQRPGALAFTWTFFSSFFASLIPDQPNVI